MTELEDDGAFELQTKRWTTLIGLRQDLTRLRMDPACVDVAIANVFDPKKGHVIDSIIQDGKELVAVALQLEELQIDSTNVKKALVKAFVPGASGLFAADLVKLKGMIKMRDRMSLMSIPTGCIEATIADVFKPLPAPTDAVKSEEASNAPTAKPYSPTAQIIEPAELDASATAIPKQSTENVSEPAELEASEAAIITRSSRGTGVGKVTESPPRTADMKPVSKDKEIGKPVEMPFERLALEPASLDTEHINVIGTSMEAMELHSSLAGIPPPSTNASSILTSPSTARGTPSTETASGSRSTSTTLPKPSGKRTAPTETALGSAENPICLESLPTAKRRRTANKVLPKAALSNSGGWRVPILSVGILGLRLKPGHVETNLNIVFDDEAHRIVFYHGQISLTALYPDLEINPEALLSVTRPTYTQTKDLKVRFMWLDPSVEETFLDIIVATKQDCRELITKLRALTSFSENLLSEPRMSSLFEDATWVVNRTQNAVGASVTKLSENVSLD